MQPGHHRFGAFLGELGVIGVLLARQVVGVTFHGDGVLVVAQGNVIGDRLGLFFWFGSQRVVITVKEHIALGGVGHGLVVFGFVGVVRVATLVIHTGLVFCV